MKCSIVGCVNEVNAENAEEMSVICCSDHVKEIVEYYREQYNREQQELYDWWLSCQ